MTRLTGFARSPFGSASIGGLLVAAAGWVAIAAGWVASPEAERQTSQAPVAATPVSGEGTGALTINEIYDRSSAGVASIRAAGKATPQPGPFGGPLPPQQASGSGFLIDDEGHVMTNAHVVEGADQIAVTLGDDEATYDAKVIGQDDSTDIAVLQIDAPSDQLEPLALGRSDQLAVGDPVVAIGNPFGLDRTVTAGIVSALQRQISAPDGFAITDVIQTDAPINPGNSGGPLLNSAGEVVGVNSQIESRSAGNVGIGFAVPIDTAREIGQELIAEGEVHHAFVGITGSDLTAEIADALNLDRESGVLIQAITPDSPADQAGLEIGKLTAEIGGQRIRAGGDLIISVDGNDVSGMDDVISAVNGKQPGDELKLGIVRDGEEKSVTLTLAERPDSANR